MSPNTLLNWHRQLLPYALAASTVILLGCATSVHHEVKGDGRKLITLSVVSSVSAREMRSQPKHWYASYPENPDLERTINATLKEAGYDTAPRDGIGWHISVVGADDVRAMLAMMRPRDPEPQTTESGNGAVGTALIVGTAAALTKMLPGAESIFWMAKRDPSTTFNRKLPITADALRYMPPDGRKYLWTRIRNPSHFAFQDCLTIAYSDFTDDELRSYNAACVADAIRLPSVAGSVSNDYWTMQHRRSKYFITGDIAPVRELPVARLTDLVRLERQAGDGQSGPPLARATAKMYEGGEIITSDSALLLTDLKPNDWALVARNSLIGFVLGPDEDQ